MYRAIVFYLPILIIFSLFVLLVAANIETILTRSDSAPSDIHIILLSTACVLVGLWRDKYTENLWDSCILHVCICHFTLFFFELDRFLKLRWRMQEQRAARLKYDPEKAAGQSPEDVPEYSVDQGPEKVSEKAVGRGPKVLPEKVAGQSPGDDAEEKLARA
jgi:hypothetical protein